MCTNARVATVQRDDPTGYYDTSVIRCPAIMKAGRYNIYGPVRCRRGEGDSPNFKEVNYEK